MATLYDHLNVPPNASQAEIKAAYRKAASKHHPDREGGDHDSFVKVQKAYEVLSDGDKRAHYDSTGEEEKPRGPNPNEVIAQVFSQLAENRDTRFTDMARLVKEHFQQQRRNVPSKGYITVARKWKQVTFRTSAPIFISVANQKRKENIQKYLQARMTRWLIDSCLKVMDSWEYRIDVMTKEQKHQAMYSSFINANPHF